jgi:protein-export membrane protein SecD
VTYAAPSTPPRRRILPVFAIATAALAVALVAGAMALPRDKPGGVRLVVAVNPRDASQAPSEVVAQTRLVIQQRLRALGADFVLPPDGSAGGREIAIDLRGPVDLDTAKSVLATSGRLELRLVEVGPAADRAALLQQFGGQPPPNVDAVSVASSAAAAPVWYLVRRDPVVTSADLSGARPALDQNNRPAVSFTLNPTGAARMQRFTAANVGRLLAIMLDDRVVSAPRIEGPISADGQIFGDFTQKEVNDLALVLRSGALPAPVVLASENTIEAVPGWDRARLGVIAAALVLALASVVLAAVAARS